MVGDPQIEGGKFDQGDAENLGDRLGVRLTEWLKLRTDQIDQKVDLRMTGLEREVLAKLDSKPGIGALVINTAVGISIIIAVLAFGGDRFNGGMSATGALTQQEGEQARRDADLDRQLKDIQRQLNTIQHQKSAAK
jgi:hypothetical protein